MKKSHKILKWYLLLASVLILIVECAVVFDIIIYKTTGNFRLMPQLNTVRFTTGEEAFEYAETLDGFIGFSPTYLSDHLNFALKWSLINAIISTFAWRMHCLHSKKLYIFTLSVLMIFLLLFAALCAFVSDSIARIYVLRIFRFLPDYGPFDGLFRQLHMSVTGH